MSQVSIPGGFSCSLRPTGQLGIRTISSSFNPWRVFVLVATLNKVEDASLQIWFQSLAGFRARCDVSYVLS